MSRHAVETHRKAGAVFSHAFRIAQGKRLWSSGVSKFLLTCLVALCVATAGLARAALPPAPAGAQVQALKITILSTMLAQQGIGEWGFAALVEADGQRILFDTGARPRTVLDNARELNIDLSQVEDVVLSHFHDDHTTGLMTLRRELSKVNPRALSRVHVGAGIFLPRRGEDAENVMIGMRKEYEAGDGTFIVHDGPVQLFPGVWLTGPVPRIYAEKNYAKGIEVLSGGEWIEDNVPDDQSLVLDTARGLVVLAGCGHAGIVNTLRDATTFTRVARVHAIVGGFHLFDMADKQLAWTAKMLGGFHVARILGAHCTGIEAVHRLRGLLGLSRRDCVVATIGATFDLRDGVHTGAIAQ